MTLTCQRELFDIPRDVAWVNCAQHSPALHSVEDAGRLGLARKRHPWTLGPQNYQVEVARLRELAAQLLGGPAQASDIALCPSAAYGLSIAAKNLTIGAGRKVVLLSDQFPSHVYPWRRAVARDGGEVQTIGRPIEGAWTASILEAIDSTTAVVALPAHHWTDGATIDLVAVGQRAREVGAALVLDLSQSLGAVPFDLAAVQPDYLVSVCYKWLLGPYNFALLYVAPHRQDGEGLEQSFIHRLGSDDSSRLTDYQDESWPDARRFDMGERGNYIAIPMAIAGLEQLLEWQPESIVESLSPIIAQIAGRAEALGLDPTPEALRAPHFLGLNFPQGVPGGLLKGLQEKGVYLSQRGNSLRISPHLYNDQMDLDRLFDGLSEVI